MKISEMLLNVLELYMCVELSSAPDYKIIQFYYVCSSFIVVVMKQGLCHEFQLEIWTKILSKIW